MEDELRATLQRFEKYFELIQAQQLSLRGELLGRIGEMRDDLLGEIAEVRDELLGEIAGVRDVLRAEIASLRTEMNERFQSVVEQLRTLTLRVQHVETGLDALRKESIQTNDRLLRVESAVIELNGRIDHLADDMRQRFRGVTERLTTIEKRNAA